MGMVILITISVFLSGCSTKKNTAASRQWQALNTRYNVYFNGKEHYDETLSQMEKNYEDDYSRMLLMHPVEALADTHYPQPSGDFTRSIEKMQKAIQLHSITKKPSRRSSSQKDKEFRERDEFNPFLHNAWLILGKSQYYNGDFTGAASTFLYIAKHFKWLREVVTEARLWEARCYCALNWNYEAENVLHLIKEKDLSDKYLKNLYNFVEADYFIKTGKYNDALPYLRGAAEKASGTQKNRLWFLAGQLYENIGETKNAYQAYKKSEGGVSTSYRTRFNSRIKQSEVFAGGDISKEVKSLKALIKYERNKEYLDQIYYAIGNLYLSRKDTVKAIENYILAIDNSERQGIDMAMAQLALGNIYFAERKYIQAQPCYSSAIPFLPDNYPGYSQIKKRSDVLDELAVYAGNVELQDSLFSLAAMPYDRQVKVAEKLVEELMRHERLEKEAEEREEYLASQQISNIQESSAFMGLQFNNDNSWYFYNNATKNAGKTAFQRKWGSRKLEDDWRRKNKNSFSFDEPDEIKNDHDFAINEVNSHNTETDPSNDKIKKETDPHFMDYYLKQIPSTPEEIETANDIIQESLYNMGLILKDKLEDYPAARHEFQRLEQRYPNNIYSLETYYNLYLMAARENDRQEAERWRTKILETYPESKYASALQDPNYIETLRQMYQIQEGLYEKAYAAYLDNENQVVHALTEEMKTKYPLSTVLPKFLFIDALAYLTEGNTDLFKDRLTELLQRWPDTDMTDMASSILKGVREGRDLQATNENTKGMIWKIRLSDREIDDIDDELSPIFESDPETPQYLVFIFPVESVNPNLVLFEVAKFNFSTFLVKDFDLEQMRFSDLGLLLVKGFSNLKELDRYVEVLEKSDLNLGPEVVPVKISKANFDILLKEGKTFEDYFRFREEQKIFALEEES